MVSVTRTRTQLSELIERLEGDVIDSDEALQTFLGKARAILAEHPIEATGGVYSAAAVLRISMDTGKKADAAKARDGQGWGVKRQLVICVQQAERRGWRIRDIYCDNDIRAFKEGRGGAVFRPEWERLKDDIATDQVDGILVQHTDRLYRDEQEYLDLERLCLTSKCHTVAAGESSDMNFGSDDDRFMGIVQAAVNAKESRRKQARMRDSAAQKARQGIPNTGRPAYGYDSPAPGKWVINEQQAVVVREVVARFLAGDSVKAITRWLQQAGHKTVTGGEWRSQTVTTLLTCGRIAGLREHNGVVAATGTWEPIISVADRDRVLARFAMLRDRNLNARTRLPRRYVLSGMVRCGNVRDRKDDPRRGQVCNGRLFVAFRGKDQTGVRRRYVCSADPDHGGCGRLTVVAEPLEAYLIDAALDVLDSPEFAAALENRAARNPDTAALSASLAADDRELKVISAEKARGDITRAEWAIQHDIISARMVTTRRQLEAAARNAGVWSLVGKGAQLRAGWAEMDVSAQQAVLRAVMVEVVILPGRKGATTLDPGRVRPVWRDADTADASATLPQAA